MCNQKTKETIWRKLRIAALVLTMIFGTLSFRTEIQAATKLAAPTIKKVTLTSETQAAISWKKVTGAKKYRVYCSEDGGKYQKIATTEDRIFIHEGLSLNTKYSYKIKAVKGKTVSSASKAKSIKTGNWCYLLDVMQPYELRYNNSWERYRDYSDTVFQMVGDSYTHGFTMENENDVYFNLHGDYETLSFTSGKISNRRGNASEVNIYKDGVLVYNFIVEPNSMPQRHTVDIADCSQLKISSSGFCELGFADITVSVAND